MICPKDLHRPLVESFFFFFFLEISGSGGSSKAELMTVFSTATPCLTSYIPSAQVPHAYLERES